MDTVWKLSDIYGTLTFLKQLFGNGKLMEILSTFKIREV
jgi:hypothetical protein